MRDRAGVGRVVAGAELDHRVGPATEPVELGPGDYAVYSGAVPHVYEALGGEATGTLLMPTPGKGSR